MTVYLRTSPEKCMERIKKRSRNEESAVYTVRDCIILLFSSLINYFIAAE